MDNLLTGTFQTRAAAETAVDRLTELGYTRNDINVFMSNETRTRTFADDHGHDHGSNLAKGAAGGAAVGGTLGALVAGALAVTGAIGATVVTGGVAAPFIVGPLAAALAGAGAGAAAGSVIGGLVGAGVPKEEAERIDRDVKGGAIVVGVHARSGNESVVRSILSEVPTTSGSANAGYVNTARTRNDDSIR